jgi:Uma2 family endonuclease
MVIYTQRITVEEFDVFVNLPENGDRLFEFVGGETIEVPSNPYASLVSSRVNGFLFVYLLQNDIAFTTGEGGGYRVSGERYAPDVALVLRSRQELPDPEGYNSVPPDIAVEVDFPSSMKSKETLTVKIGNYLAAGTIVWAIFPDRKEVEVYAPGEPVRKLGIKDTLDGGDLLPGFTLPIKDIFPE